MLVKQKHEQQEKKCFDQKVYQAKTRMQSGISLTQATSYSSPVSPPKKKCSSKKSKLPYQSNKVTFYFTPSPPEPKHPPVLSEDKQHLVVFKTAPTDAIGNFRYPMPISKPHQLSHMQVWILLASSCGIIILYECWRLGVTKFFK